MAANCFDSLQEFIAGIRESEQCVISEFRLKNKNTGEYMWVVAKGKGIRKMDGSIVAYVTYTDDTERKKLQGMENALMVEKAANKAKTDFLSNMSHDMRTPMNGILGVTTLMMDQELPEEVRSNLSQIQMSGKYLLNLINDTLDVSKIEADKLELHPVVTDAYRLTDNFKANASLFARDRNVNFEVRYIDPEKVTKTMLFIDASRVEQIASF